MDNAIVGVHTHRCERCSLLLFIVIIIHRSSFVVIVAHMFFSQRALHTVYCCKIIISILQLFAEFVTLTWNFDE